VIILELSLVTIISLISSDCIGVVGVKLTISFPLSKSQILVVWEYEDEIILDPSGVTAMAHRLLETAGMVLISRPVFMSQILMFRSVDPDITLDPSGVTARQFIDSVWPVRVWRRGLSGDK
jgi:hypothetical protein